VGVRVQGKAYVGVSEVYDVQRGAWVACERCSGTARVVVYLYPKLNRRSR
jgi:hypothetical protein